LSFADEVTTVNNLVPELVAKGVSAIVVLIHEGGMTTASTINDKTCPNISGPIVSIADRFDSRVDAVISAHSHQEYVCTRPDGKLLTQTGFSGRAVTKIDLMISPDTKRVISKTANNLPVINTNVIMANGAPVPLPAGLTPLTPDPAIAALVQQVATLSAPLTGRVIGNITMPLTRTINAAGEGQVGAIIADAYLDGTSGSTFRVPAQIGLTNIGGIRANLPNTVVTFGDLFTVTPFGNNLVTIDLTGEQLLRVLEQQWEAPQPTPGRIMQISNGFSYTWDASKPFGAARGMGNRVIASSMRLNGAPIVMSTTYRVTINNFMASGGDNYTVFTQGKNSQSSDIDIDVGVAYFRKLGTVPTPALNRITRIN
jgi:5'-nucleotidase